MKNPLLEFLDNLKGKVVLITGSGDFSQSDLENPLDRDNDRYFTPGMLTRVVDWKITSNGDDNDICIETNVKEFEKNNFKFECHEYCNPKTGEFNLGPREAECYTKSGIVWIVINLYDKNFPFEVSLKHN